VLIAALLVFTMTIAVGFLEVGELGEEFDFSLLKTILMTGSALVVMAFVGFNTAFAPTAGGVIGHPFYSPGFFLGGFSSKQLSPTGDVWWSMRHAFFNTGLTPATYFLFETAFAAVTFARGAGCAAQAEARRLHGLRGRLLHPDLESAGRLDLEPDWLAREARDGRFRGRTRRARRRRRRGTAA
jgi:ammonia channel protein AmtB